MLRPWCLLLLLVSVTSRAQVPNVQVNAPSSTTPEEVTIAINPMNPQNLVGGANLRFFYHSTDGGISWAQGQLTSPFGVYGDPCVIFDAAGNAYYGHLSNPSGGDSWLDRIVVPKSTDGGKTWSDGAGIGLNPPKDQDKEWLAADMTSSPYRNNLYVAWTEFDAYGSALATDSTRILLSRSTDAGATWSAPVRVSDRAGDCVDEDNTVEGAVPAVGPQGEVYLSWAGPLGIMFDKSTDGGVTWGKDVFITSQPGGWDFGVSGIYRCNGLPVTACDVSASPYRGRIYVLWSDQRNRVNSTIDNTDVFIIRSDDGGATWTAQRQVNGDITTRDQFFPWLTIDQTNGTLYVVFYDRRNTQGDTTEVWVARSTDGGESFTNFRVSATPFVPASTIFFGDYTSIAALNGRVYPFWMRLDGTLLSVWVGLVRDTVAVGVEAQSVPPATLTLGNYPNPFNSSTRVRFVIPQDPGGASRGVRAVLRLYDQLGRDVGTLFDGVISAGAYELDLNGSSPGVWNLASGTYFVRLTAGSAIVTHRVVLLK
jgi:hypothetical protein